MCGQNPIQMEHIRSLANQARDDSNGNLHLEMGFNYKMTNIEAALGLAQFERLEEFLKRKRRFHQIYEEALGGKDNCLLGEYSGFFEDVS